MKKLILIILLILMLFPSVAYAYNPEVEVLEQQLRRAKNEQRGEYYRGIYDTCMYANYLGNNPYEASVKACLEFAEKARKSKWYEHESPGWQWPIDRTGMI